jgi:hypothetical protein
LIRIALLAALALAGCGHCLQPEQRAARHGVVLECRPTRHGDTSCTISTKDGDKAFIYRSVCE